MAEWLNAAVLKTVKDVSPSGVRIPVSPQCFILTFLKVYLQIDGITDIAEI